jgi:putative two-component system protein, hydrogenase maturation factor HypX/HoxX
MRILFLTSAHNSLSQRLWIELGERGHDIHVCVATTDAAMIAAVSNEAPDLILAPMLKIAIPEEIWSRHLCLIVHPGIRGDRGPSSLDWAITNNEKTWGVTILESAVARIESGEFQSGAWGPEKLSDVAPDTRGRLRPPMRQTDRAIDWLRDKTATIMRKIRAADSAPGVLATLLLGQTCFLYGAHEEDRLQGPPGQILAQRNGAVCIGTIDGAVWISHLKTKADADGGLNSAAGIKLPAAQSLWFGILDIYATPAGGAEAGAGTDPVVQANGDTGGLRDWIARRCLRRGCRGFCGRTEGAGKTPRPGSGIPLNASPEAGETSR